MGQKTRQLVGFLLAALLSAAEPSARANEPRSGSPDLLRDLSEARTLELVDETRALDGGSKAFGFVLDGQKKFIVYVPHRRVRFGGDPKRWHVLVARNLDLDTAAEVLPRSSHEAALLKLLREDLTLRNTSLPSFFGGRSKGEVLSDLIECVVNRKRLPLLVKLENQLFQRWWLLLVLVPVTLGLALLSRVRRRLGLPRFDGHLGAVR